jgi:hypothetical protein
MGARHETEVLISPTIESERGKLIPACPRLPLRDRCAAEGRLGSDGSCNFKQVRAKGCAMDVPCLNVVGT